MLEMHAGDLAAATTGARAMVLLDSASEPVFRPPVRIPRQLALGWAVGSTDRAQTSPDEPG